MIHISVGLHRFVLVKFVARGDDDSPHLHLDDLGPHIVVNGIRFARFRALPTRQGKESHAGIGVECIDRRHRLGMGNVDRATGGQSPVKLVGHHHRADLGAIVTGGALFLDDVAGMAQDFHPEISNLSLHVHHFTQRQQADVGMLPNLDRARREDALGTIQRREGF